VPTPLHADFASLVARTSPGELRVMITVRATPSRSQKAAAVARARLQGSSRAAAHRHWRAQGAAPPRTSQTKKAVGL